MRDNARAANICAPSAVTATSHLLDGKHNSASRRGPSRRSPKGKKQIAADARGAADRLALEAHLALDILRRGQDRACDAQSLLQTMMSSQP